jgi:hypothetical protein
LKNALLAHGLKLETVIQTVSDFPMGPPDVACDFCADQDQDFSGISDYAGSSPVGYMTSVATRIA